MVSLLDQLLGLLVALVNGGTGLLRVQLADFGGGTSGSVGHLIAAAMQTAGVYAQAEILTNFQGFLEKLAALCYLAAIIGALMSAGLFGNYQKALYLLVGPPLFFFMVTTTKTVSGTEVKTGERVAEGSIEDQIKFLRSYASTGKFTQAAEVSYFFVGFDNLVSSIVQGIVSVIIDTKQNEDLIVKARERVLAWTLLATPNDNGFTKLVSLGVMGECSEVMRRKWQLQTHRADPRSDSIEEDNLTAVGQKMKREYDLEKDRPRFELDHEVIAVISPDPKTQSDFQTEKWSCQQIWDETHRIARAFADKQLDIRNFLATGGEDGAVPWERVQEEIRLALDNGGNANDVLAAYIVKNAIAKTTHASMTSGIFDRVPFNAERRSGIFEDVAGIHRYGGYLRVQYFARTIPYIQGILLYLLSCAFPFFAVFLVMPGRANTFLIWISLWIWVKSWDVGFALVSVARKMLWLFVRGGVNKYDAANVPTDFMRNGGIDWSKPESIFALISANDPLATQNTYFTIVGVLTIGVPFITAHLCLGAGQLWDVFSMSLSQKGDYYFVRRMKQLSRTDYASPAEKAQDIGRHKAAIEGNNAGVRDMKTGGGTATAGTGPGAPGGGGPGGGGGLPRGAQGAPEVNTKSGVGSSPPASPPLPRSSNPVVPGSFGPRGK